MVYSLAQMTIPGWSFYSGVSQDLSHRAAASSLSSLSSDHLPQNFNWVFEINI